MSWYSEKLKDVRWQKVRLEVLARDEFRCQSCHTDEASATRMGRRLTLHVHHTYYEAGRDPWEYPTGSLTTLCDSCHEREPAASCKRAEARLIKALKNLGYKAYDIDLLASAFDDERIVRPRHPIDFTYSIGKVMNEPKVRRLIEDLELTGDLDSAKAIFEQSDEQTTNPNA